MREPYQDISKELNVINCTCIQSPICAQLNISSPLITHFMNKLDSIKADVRGLILVFDDS